jgi:hypothetical protein
MDQMEYIIPQQIVFTSSLIVFTSSRTDSTIDTTQWLYGNGTGLTNIGCTYVIHKPNLNSTSTTLFHN